MTIVTFLLSLLLLYGIWRLCVHKGLKHLSCRRSFSKDTLFVGEEAELVEVVRNDKPFIIPWLLIESQISPYLRLGNQENLHVSGNTHFCSQFTLMPYQQILRRHRVRFLHRGSYNLGNATLTTGDFLGFSKFHRTQNLPAPVLVYPQLIADNNLPIPIASQLEEISRQPQLLQDPFLFRGLRPYLPGDPVRDIHWAATARTGEVQVRVHDYSARTRFLVVLNAQIHEIQWHDHVTDDNANQIEYGISLAATACVKALRKGLSVGFAANMPVDQEQYSVCMLPTDGSNREEVLLTTFARLRIHRTQSIISLLDSLTVHSGMNILVLSAYDSDNIQASIQKLQRSGNQVLFQLLEGGTK